MAELEDDLGAALDDADHENLLPALVKRLLTAASLPELCEDSELPVLVDDQGQPVHLAACHTYRQAGVMTLNPGVWLELSDGSAFGLTLTVSRRPHSGTELRATTPDPRLTPPSATGDPRKEPRP